MTLNSGYKEQHIPLCIRQNTLSAIPFTLIIQATDSRTNKNDTPKSIVTDLKLSIFNYSIPLVSIVNIVPHPHVAIQLLEDETIDDDEYVFVADESSSNNSGLEEDILGLSIEDAFLENIFLEDGWRALQTVILLRASEPEAAKICSEIYGLVCENSNKWLNLVLEN